MKTTTFEEYLEKICFEDNPSVLDDDMPDFFNSWLANLDGEEYLKYGNDLIAQAEQEMLKKIREKIEKVKVITPTVELPPNKLSQNQIFAGGQANMFLRITEALASLNKEINNKEKII